MSKKTNNFQKLAAHIQVALAALTGSVVYESYEMIDRNGIKREIDILVVGKISGYEIKIALECREYSRTQNVTWIDQIIGKYKDLDINKVIAISNTDFSESAIQKAEQNRIELQTLKQAESIEWNNIFNKHIVRFIDSTIVLKAAEIITEPNINNYVKSEVQNLIIQNENGTKDDTVFKICLWLFKDAKIAAKIEIERNLANYLEVEHGKKHNLFVKYEMKGKQIVIDSNVCKLNEMVLHIEVEIKKFDAIVKNVLLNEKAFNVHLPPDGHHLKDMASIVLFNDNEAKPKGCLIRFQNELNTTASNKKVK